MADIDKLVVQIESDSTSAVSGIDALATSLGKLKSATSGGMGLSSIAKNINNIKSSLSSVGKIGNDTQGLTKAVLTLKQLGSIKVSASIGNQIKNIGESLSTLNIGNGATKITELVSALKPLETLGKSTLSTTVNALNKLPEAINKIDMKKLYGQVSSLTRTFKPLADEMQKIANGFNAFPSRIQKLIKENGKLASSNKETANSYVDLWAKMRMAYNTVKTGAKLIASAISKSMDYTENVNLFNVSMGKYTDEARAYAEEVGEVMGIDPGEWMRNQGTIMALATGFGVAADRAYTMSESLTELSYDLSSLFNLPIEETMQKVQSGLAGELEPLRRIGFDLSVARLQQEAYTLGINKKVSAMTQAEKAELRYYAIMTQVTASHKDMARTLDAPANQLRVLKAQVDQAARAIGNIFIPVLQAVLPYCIAFFKVITLVANAIAKLVGFKEFTADLGNMDSLASGAGDYSDALGGAADNAKKLQKYTMGFDELNVIDPNVGSGGAGDAGAGGGGFDFELPEYNFLSEEGMGKVNKIVESLKDNLSTVLTIVAGIGAAIAGWAISKAVTLGSALAKMAGLKFSLPLAFVGLTLFLQDLTTLKDYIDDFKENGASFYNVSGIISTFAGLIGDALILLGNVKIGGALKVIEGVGQVIGAIADMSENGVNWTNVMSAINGLSNIAIGIGVFTGNLQLVGGGMAVQGLTTVIDEIKRNWEAIKSGDWSGVDKVALAIGGIEAIGGLLMALGVFSKIKNATNTASAGKQITDVGKSMGEMDTSFSQLTSKLGSLVKNLALGIVILAEVAVAAGIVVGAIWGLGLMLGQVAEAWQPVIDNGDTVAIAMGIGIALLVAIGVVTAVLGSIGTTLIVSLALGIAMLALLGVSAALFLGEIILIGVLLDQIRIAWEPVLANGDTIATAIGIGTALLIAIGVVAALLGVAAVASCGMLPLAIALGTAMLLELGLAAAVFLIEIIKMADYLVQIGVAWEPVLANGATIEQAIKTGTALLVAIGVVTAALGVATVASAGLLPVAIALGTALLVELGDSLVEFVKSLTKVAKSLTNKLHPALKKLNDILPELNTNMEAFTDFMIDFAEMAVKYTASSAIAGLAGTIDTIIGFFTKDPIESLSDDVEKQYKQSKTLNENLALANPELSTAIKEMKTYKTRLDNLKGVVDTIDNSDMGKDVFTDLVEVADKVVDFGGKMKDYYNKIKDLKTSVMDDMADCVNDIIDFAVRIKDEVEIKKINSFADAIKKLATEIKTLPTKKTVTIDITYKTNGGGVKGYATGGFPQTGELFVAREAGAEMVGSIGRRTAVANNDQIVEGIKYGVSTANEESNILLREQNSLLRELLAKDTGTYLDGKLITNSVEKYQRSRGRVLVTGGAY